MKKILDIEGKEVSIGDKVLIATTQKKIVKGTVEDISDGVFGSLLSIKTINNRETRIYSNECYKLTSEYSLREFYE